MTSDTEEPVAISLELLEKTLQLVNTERRFIGRLIASFQPMNHHSIVLQSVMSHHNEKGVASKAAHIMAEMVKKAIREK